MPQLTFITDRETGTLLVGGEIDRADMSLGNFFGMSREIGCARPRTILSLPPATPEEIAAEPCVRTGGIYHHSLIEGPGRRSCALLIGCNLGCAGCWVPHLHDPEGGQLVPVGRLADALLDPAHPRDGISLLGGEPFYQPDGLLALVRALRVRGCPHILCYSGHTYERLRRRAGRQPAIGAVLDAIDMLVDGPYVEALADSAGPWTGSGNQRVLALAGGQPVPWPGT